MPLITAASGMVSLLPAGCRRWLLTGFRHVGGYVGLGMRYALCRSLAASCGECVAIFPGVYLLNVEGLVLGNNVSIHPMCYVDGAGGISIGNDVSIAHATTILSAEHTFAREDRPIREQAVRLAKTTIEDDCWIGARVTVLGGRTIGRGSVVAAGSVVTKDVDPNTVVGGVPAKLIRMRAAA